MVGRPNELTVKQPPLKCGHTIKHKARLEVLTAVLIKFQVFLGVTLDPEDGYTTLLRRAGKYVSVEEV
jgi:hypothetical protein